MRQGSIRLGRIAGVPLSMDLGVLVVGGLLTWILASAVLPNGAPGRVGSVYWSVAVIGALLFLASLLAHELAHAIVARRNGVQVQGITLWLFGGFAQFESEPPSPGAEFRITAAGPATSLGLAVLFGASAFGLAVAGAPDVYATLLMWLGIINGFLGVFNLLPGAPLDGGRILAAALWKLRGDRISGRIGAATVGKFVGAGLIGLGVFEMLAIRGFGGLWTAFIGWFLFNAARAEHVHFSGERALGDLTVGEAMAPLGEPIRSWSTVADLVEGPLRTSQRSSVPVADFSGRIVGVVSMADVRRLPAERWSSTTVAEVVADDELTAVDVAERLSEVLGRGVAGGRGFLLATRAGQVVGLVGPDEVHRAIELGRLRGGRPRQSSTPPPPPVAAPQQRWDPPVPTR